MTMDDLDFCKQHLAKWCKQQGKSAAVRMEMWSYFLRDPGYHYTKGTGWSEVYRHISKEKP